MIIFCKFGDNLFKRYHLEKVAQWIKSWPAARGLCLTPAVGNLFNHKWHSTEHSLLLSPSHCLDMTEILLKEHIIENHPSIHLLNP